jgi:large subunit ribosomal protein L11
MGKKIVAIVKLALKAGKATPAPPIGPALGQHGINIGLFCKEYNAKTADKGDLVVPVEISVFEDRSFTFILKTPPASVLLKQITKTKKGSATPNKANVGKITRAELEEVAKMKIVDLNTQDIAKAMKIIEGTAKNMGISIEG